MKKPFPVPDSIRANVKEDLSPMLGEIKDPQMRDYVVEAWAASLFLNGFTAVHELQGSGALDVLVQKNASQAAHLCGTAKISKMCIRDRNIPLSFIPSMKKFSASTTFLSNVCLTPSFAGWQIKFQ